MFKLRRPQPVQATRKHRFGSRRALNLVGALLVLGMAACLPASARTAVATSIAPGQATNHLAADSSKATPDKPQVVPVNVSAAQAARAARNEYGGRVLDVRLEANDKAPYYRVKLLSGGRVQVVYVTAHE